MPALNMGQRCWNHRMFFFLLVFFLIQKTQASLVVPVQPPDPSRTVVPVRQCRDRLGSFPEQFFDIHACCMCLDYLFPNSHLHYRVNVSLGFAALQSPEAGHLVFARPGDPKAMTTVCETLGTRACHDWTACCKSAEDCCHRQLDLSGDPSTGEDDDRDSSDSRDTVDGCPMTWDGYSCVEEALAGQTAVIQCPDFIGKSESVSRGVARRQCWSNSSWYINQLGLEWTDYSDCYKVDSDETVLILKLVFNGVSLSLLIPSVVIFLLFRPLRSQLRIKIHINLFLALALTATFSILWEAIIHRDLLEDEDSETFIKQHNVACKFLNVTSRCALMSTFLWMFCEGLYLTWLMLQSLRHISSMIPFHLCGWGIPLLFCAIYTIVRASEKDDGRCWMTGAGSLEWLIDGPTVACIVVNVVFLLAIMRVMIRQLRSHNTEQQSLVGRSLRAFLILVPLFGLQQFCILYRPRPQDAGFRVYEVASAAIVNLQGALVAFIFCFFNGEVRGHLRDLYRRLRYKLSGRHRRYRQSVSTASSVFPRPSRPSLASINTTASVILASVHIATGARHNDHADDGDSSPGRSSGWRLRVASISEQDEDGRGVGNGWVAGSDIMAESSTHVRSESCRFVAPSETADEGLSFRGRRNEGFDNDDGRLDGSHEREDGNTPCGSVLHSGESEGASNQKEFKSGVDKKETFAEDSVKDFCTKKSGNPERDCTEVAHSVVVPMENDEESSVVVDSQTNGALASCTSTVPLGETEKKIFADKENGNNVFPNANCSQDSRDPERKWSAHIHECPSFSSISIDEGISSKDSCCSEDYSDSLNLVHTHSFEEQSNIGSFVDHNSFHARTKQVSQPHDAGHSFLHVKQTLGINRKGRPHVTSTESPHNNVNPLRHASSLQDSDSTASFALLLTREMERDESSVDETENSGIVRVGIVQEFMANKKEGSRQQHEASSYLNSAFTQN